MISTGTRKSQAPFVFTWTRVISFYVSLSIFASQHVFRMVVNLIFLLVVVVVFKCDDLFFLTNLIILGINTDEQSFWSSQMSSSSIPSHMLTF